MFAGLGGLLLFIGAIWLVVLSFQTGQSTGEKIVWALVNFFLQPIGGIIFFFVKKAGMVPMILCIVGAILYGVGIFSAVSSAIR